MNFRDPSGLAACFEGESVISCLGRDGLTVDEFNKNYCEPWPECWFQEAADYWARRGGLGGSLGLNLAAAGNGLSEAFGVNSLGANVQSGNIAGAGMDLAMLSPLGRIARGSRLAIGKLDDFVRAGLPGPNLPNLGSPQANWRQNSSMLRQYMRDHRAITDLATDANGNLINNTGFLAAERNLLRNRGWTYNPRTRTWSPGG